MNAAIYFWMMYIWLLGVPCGITPDIPPSPTNQPTITILMEENELLRGVYNPKTDDIKIYFNRDLESTIVHELTHACQQRSNALPTMGKNRTLQECQAIVDTERIALTIENQYRKEHGGRLMDINSTLQSYYLDCILEIPGN